MPDLDATCRLALVYLRWDRARREQVVNGQVGRCIFLCRSPNREQRQLAGSTLSMTFEWVGDIQRDNALDRVVRAGEVAVRQALQVVVALGIAHFDHETGQRFRAEGI